MSHQDLVEMDESGRQVRNRMRMLVRGVRAGTDRFPVSFWVDADPEAPGPDAPPTIRPLIGATLGRTIVAPDERLVMAEAILDHPLGEGETSLIEFECTPGGKATVSTRWERGLLRTLPLYLVSVTFHPDRMPTTVERFERPLRTDQVRATPVLVTSPCVTVPVSYTHLDVYKRQVHLRRRRDDPSPGDVRGEPPRPRAAHPRHGEQRRRGRGLRGQGCTGAGYSGTGSSGRGRAGTGRADTG